ncbi:MAG TPA: helix-turn-helix transcriptional regulator [Thermoanaerobaculia bacterium]|nr:helix-turn-helix transcriptional regulator [Thermoanaerobaculia bacterium]
MQDNETPVIKQVGERVSRLRRNQGWKQKELAAQIGCSLQQVSKLERGRWVPRVSVLLRIAEAFNVTADYLLTGRGPQHPGVDLRLRERLPALDRLPASQRDSLVLFLDGLILAHRYAGKLLPAGGDEGGSQ